MCNQIQHTKGNFKNHLDLSKNRSFLMVAVRVICRVIVVSKKFGIVLNCICYFALYLLPTGFQCTWATLSWSAKLDLPELNLSDFRLVRKLFLASYWQLFNANYSLAYRKSWLLFAFVLLAEGSIRIIDRMRIHYIWTKRN